MTNPRANKMRTKITWGIIMFQKNMFNEIFWIFWMIKINNNPTRTKITISFFFILPPLVYMCWSFRETLISNWSSFRLNPSFVFKVWSHVPSDRWYEITPPSSRQTTRTTSLALGDWNCWMFTPSPSKSVMLYVGGVPFSTSLPGQPRIGIHLPSPLTVSNVIK